MTRSMISAKERSLLKTIETIEEFFPLDYTKEVNALFRTLEKQISTTSCLNNDTVYRLRTIWAQRGFSMERYFANACSYQEFDFYSKYKKLLKFDSLIIRKQINIKHYSKIIFIGSGPLPLSLKLLRIPIQKVGYDLSSEAVSLAKKSLPKDRFGMKITYQEGDFFSININEREPVIIYIAGLIQNKIKGIKRLAKQLPKNSFLIVRTVARDNRSFLYEPIDKKALSRLGKVKEFIPTKASGIVNGMITIKI